MCQWLYASSRCRAQMKSAATTLCFSDRAGLSLLFLQQWPDMMFLLIMTLFRVRSSTIRVHQQGQRPLLHHPSNISPTRRMLLSRRKKRRLGHHRFRLQAQILQVISSYHCHCPVREARWCSAHRTSSRTVHLYWWWRGPIGFFLASWMQISILPWHRLYVFSMTPRMGVSMATERHLPFARCKVCFPRHGLHLLSSPSTGNEYHHHWQNSYCYDYDGNYLFIFAKLNRFNSNVATTSVFIMWGNTCSFSIIFHQMCISRICVRVEMLWIRPQSLGSRWS